MRPSGQAGTTLGSVEERNIPLDGKARHSRLVGENVAADLVDNGLGGGVGGEFVRLVLVIDIIANTDKLAAIVGAGQENDSDAKDVGVGNAARLRSIGLEDELVYTDGDGANEERVELLVVLITVNRSLALENRLIFGHLWKAKEKEKLAARGWLGGQWSYEVAEPT